MSNNDYILNLLNIKEKMIKNKNYKIIEGILTYKPDFCPVCGTINESSNDILKYRTTGRCLFYNSLLRTSRICSYEISDAYAN